VFTFICSCGVSYGGQRRVGIAGQRFERRLPRVVGRVRRERLLAVEQIADSHF
jgi:hypothetical protein